MCRAGQALTGLLGIVSLTGSKIDVHAVLCTEANSSQARSSMHQSESTTSQLSQAASQPDNSCYASRIHYAASPLCCIMPAGSHRCCCYCCCQVIIQSGCCCQCSNSICLQHMRRQQHNTKMSGDFLHISANSRCTPLQEFMHACTPVRLLAVDFTFTSWSADVAANSVRVGTLAATVLKLLSEQRENRTVSKASALPWLAGPSAAFKAVSCLSSSASAMYDSADMGLAVAGYAN